MQAHDSHWYTVETQEKQKFRRKGTVYHRICKDVLYSSFFISSLRKATDREDGNKWQKAAFTCSPGADDISPCLGT